MNPWNPSLTWEHERCGRHFSGTRFIRRLVRSSARAQLVEYQSLIGDQWHTFWMSPEHWELWCRDGRVLGWVKEEVGMNKDTRVAHQEVSQ